MARIRHVFGLLLIGLLLTVLAGCGNDGDRIVVSGPGLVGIDDRPVSATPPILTVEYALPDVPGSPIIEVIVSDQPTDGDIAFDPVFGAFTITQGPDIVFFGVDNFDPSRSEYRAFLDFPLDGSTGQPVIPIDAIIVSATLNVFIEIVDFAPRVPVLLDLVSYDIGGLVPADYDSPYFAFIAFDLFASDAGRDVSIDVTGLMAEAQFQTLDDFQVRFLLRP